MDKHSKVYVAGHSGLVGSAIVRKLQAEGYVNLITRAHTDLDLIDQAAVWDFFGQEQPEYVFLAAAKVGGIWANDMYPADFIRDNLFIQSNVVDAAYRRGVKKLLFMGSSHLPKACSPTYEGGASPDWVSRTHQRMVCSRQDRGNQDVSGLPASVRLSRYYPDAD